MQQGATNLSYHHIVLEGKRLILEVLSTENVSENYAAWVQDPEVNKYLEIRHSPPQASSLKDYVSRMDHSDRDLLFGIFEKQDRQHIGNIKVGPIDFLNRRSLVGIMIGEKNAWGKGYGTEAIEILSDYALGSLKLHRLYAGVVVSNQGSARIFEKAGYRKDGVFREHARLGDGYEDCIWYSRLAMD